MLFFDGNKDKILDKVKNLSKSFIQFFFKHQIKIHKIQMQLIKLKLTVVKLDVVVNILQFFFYFVHVSKCRSIVHTVYILGRIVTYFTSVSL